MRRREFIQFLGSSLAGWPLAARAQQSAMPIVGLVNSRSARDAVPKVAAFRKGLNETGYVEGQNVMVEYHWLEGQYHRLPTLMDDLVRGRVAVIATPAFRAGALAAKAATSTIPIVFSVGDDPVKLGLVASLARPGGNATGVNSFATEVVAKRLGLLHDLLPKAVRIAVLVNPANPPVTEANLRDIPETARALGLQNRWTISEPRKKCRCRSGFLQVRRGRAVHVSAVSADRSKLRRSRREWPKQRTEFRTSGAFMPYDRA
jgi:putative ABC transport system substrate-binding protein